MEIATSQPDTHGAYRFVSEFTRDLGLTMFESLALIKVEEWAKPAMCNLIKCFELYGKPIVGEYGSIKKSYPEFYHRMTIVCGEQGASCHIVGPDLAHKYPEMQYHFAFADYRHPETGEYEKTFCHSIAVGKDGKIYDPFYEYWYCGADEVEKRILGYYGFSIPTPLVSEIFLSLGKGYYENMANYLFTKVFPRNQATENFFESIRS